MYRLQCAPTGSFTWPGLNNKVWALRGQSRNWSKTQTIIRGTKNGDVQVT